MYKYKQESGIFYLVQLDEKVKILLSPTLSPPYVLSPFFKTFVTHPPKINELDTAVTPTPVLRPWQPPKIWNVHMSHNRYCVPYAVMCCTCILHFAIAAINMQCKITHWATLGVYFKYTFKSGSDCMFSEVYLKYAAVLLAFACKITHWAALGVYFKYTFKSGSDCMFSEVYLKYTAVLLAFACTEVYFKYTDENKERQYTQSILYRPKYIVLKVYSVQFAQMDRSILQVYW